MKTAVQGPANILLATTRARPLFMCFVNWLLWSRERTPPLALGGVVDAHRREVWGRGGVGLYNKDGMAVRRLVVTTASSGL